METFHKLFGSLLVLVYHCFDRIVIQGYLPLLTREEHIVHFFRDVHGVYPITKDALRARTTEYQQWVEAFARHHRIPIEWADNKALKTKGLTREAYVRPYCRRMERRKRYGPYFIFKSLDQGPKFQVSLPKRPTQDPHYRIIGGPAVAIPIITSTFGTRCSAPSLSAWGRSSPSRPRTT
jgi:hypothetical protein